MSVKVKRGLGLLVVAAAAWLVTWGLLQSTAIPANVLALVTGAVMVGAGVVGTTLLAWGLLRD